MGQIKRARSPEDKRRRARRILDAARGLEAAAGFHGLVTADVARAAGVAKGTVFLYFPTKEALGLALLEDQLWSWFDGLDRALATPAREPRAVAHLLTASLAERPALRRLLSIQGMLEGNVAPDALARFKARLLERLRETGTRLEAVAPFLARGDGIRLLQFVHVLVAGIHPMAEPAAPAREALAGPGLVALRIDFAGSLESALRVHLEGLRALRQRGD